GRVHFLSRPVAEVMARRLARSVSGGAVIRHDAAPSGGVDGSTASAEGRASRTSRRAGLARVPGPGVVRRPERSPLSVVGLVAVHTSIRPFSPRTRPMMRPAIHASLQGSIGPGYGAGMVTARSTAWRVAAARPSARQRDRAVRLPPSVWARLLADTPTVAAYHT